MWQQTANPFHQFAASAGAAVLPILVLFALLISRKVAGHLAAACTLGVALLVAILAFGMPLGLAALSAAYGALNGLFPIGWILIAAVFLYNLSVKSGSFATLTRSIESVTADRRLQALLIAFCFGAFLEGCAGFGAPVAITTGMLVGLGFQPLYAAGICLLANSAPVAFGSIGIPIVTAGQTSGVDPALIGRMVVHQLPVLTLILPFWLVVLISGWKGVKGVWPAVLVTAVSYTVTMVLVAQFLGPMLPNILSSLVSILCLVLFLRVWKPREIWRFPQEPAYVPSNDQTHLGFGPQVRAWTPFLLLILFVGNWGVAGIKALLDRASVKIPISGLDGAILAGGKPLAVVYPFGWLSAAGTAIFLAALLAALLLRMPARQVIDVAGDTLRQLRRPLITICSVVGFAFLANYAGMSLALGSALTVSGHFFPLLSPLVGWIGVFVSGSDTAANALFSSMQKTTATHLGLNPLLTIAANTDGGVTAKMISPQSIAVAAASSSLVGQEGRLFRMTLPHSLGLLGIVCILTYLQAYALPGMVPALPPSALSAAKPGPAPLGAAGITILAASALVLAALACVNARSARTRAAE
jgi:lactate permease